MVGPFSLFVVFSISFLARIWNEILEKHSIDFLSDVLQHGFSRTFLDASSHSWLDIFKIELEIDKHKHTLTHRYSHKYGRFDIIKQRVNLLPT